LIIFNDKNEAYFESLTIFLEKPVEKTIRIQETTIDDVEEEIAKHTKPRVKVVESRPKDNVRSKYSNY
jgi:hypothetical protein